MLGQSGTKRARAADEASISEAMAGEDVEMCHNW